MSIIRSHSRRVLIVGYVIFAYGVTSTVVDFVARAQFAFPRNMGIIIGNGAITIVGLVAVIIAKCLMKLEERVHNIEQSKPGNTRI